jgi:hypothetical protein
MFLGHAAPDYAMFGQPQTMAPTQQEAMHAAGAFGRMTLSPDHALEKLAANVRAATTTSASDRAKQIFVQAWCVFCHVDLMIPTDVKHISPPSPKGLPPTTLLIQMAMSPDKGFIFPTAASATSTGSRTLIPPPWEKPLGCAFPLSKPAAWE